MAGSRRNYKAMRSPKLLDCIRELENQYGDAYQRCVAKGGDPAVDLAIAQGEARDRGLVTTSRELDARRPPARAESYDELTERIQAITSLNARQASVVAAEFPEGTSPDKQQVIDRAEALGYQP